MNLTLGWINLPVLLGALAAVNVLGAFALVRAEIRARRNRPQPRPAPGRPTARETAGDPGDLLVELIRRVEEDERRAEEERRATAA